MIYANQDKFDKELKVDCEKCFGLCCIALYFSAFEGFPTNKEAGKPCLNLQSDFTCAVHRNLMTHGLKGCTAYDCFGAGQKVAQVTFGGRDWREFPDLADKMFNGFLIMRQLHEMLWYLKQAFHLQSDKEIKNQINSLIESTENLTISDIESLLVMDIESHRIKVNEFLKITSEMIRNKVRNKKNMSTKNTNAKRKDYFGKDLRKIDLRGADLRGACLIASNLKNVDLSGADLIGADLRDADISGANLTDSIFITQSQINTARGDFHTQLPKILIRPASWAK